MFLLLIACKHVADNKSDTDTYVSDTADTSLPQDSIDTSEPWSPEPIVIIGAGIAGLAAAQDLPNSIILEKNTDIGGRFRWAGGVMTFVDTQDQQQAGITDSVDQAIAEWPLITGEAATPETIAFLEASSSVRDRLVSQGVLFNIEQPIFEGVTNRTHLPIGGGPSVVTALSNALPSDVEFRLGQEAQGIVIKNGRVTGVSTANGILEAHTVIIASGGFVGRMDILSTVVDYPTGTWFEETDGASGFAIDQADLLGLTTSRMESIGWFDRTIGVPNAEGRPMNFIGAMGIPWIFVDSQAERFINELQIGSLSMHGVLLQQNAWALTTWELITAGVSSADLPYLESADPSQFRCSSDWPSLASDLGLDPDALITTLAATEDYRQETLQDPLLRPGSSFPDLNGTPCAFQPGHEAAKNFGGLAVDADGRVPGVDGLWAIGEAAGMAVPGMGGAWGFDGSSAAILWGAWRSSALIAAQIP